MENRTVIVYNEYLSTSGFCPHAVKRVDNTVTPLYAFTDNLGSVTRLYTETGMEKFRAQYDPWGVQLVSKNNINFARGYCGHEMLNDFHLINMNGRMYDPVLGRFLSPDNYVQMPTSAQSFNRYSYCLNNPLKYTDPSGELFGIDDAVFAFALYNMASSMMMMAAYNGQSVLKAGGLSLLSSAASYGIGSAFGGVGSFGHELLRAGSHGFATGAINALNGDSFGRGFLTGSLSSGIGSFAQGVHMDTELMLASTTALGGLASWAAGGDFLSGAMQGLIIGIMNHKQHDPTDEIEKRKMLYRHKYKTDSNARKKAIADIEKDGKLSFKEAFYWYQYGDGSTIHVDASKLDLGSINVAGKKVGEQWVIPTLSLSKDYNVGLVYGRLKVEYMGNNSFRILHDEYNFDIQFKGFFKWSILKRNFETIGASILHGTGTTFIINFNGLYHNK